LVRAAWKEFLTSMGSNETRIPAMAPNSLLQDAVYVGAIRSGVPAAIYLVNGTRLVGRVVGMDQYTLLVESSGRGAPVMQLVYKAAVSTLSPEGGRGA
jgi:RNA chaperone Hfq